MAGGSGAASAAGGAGAGAAAGAQIGSIVPGVGTAWGAGIGAVVGAGLSLFAGSQGKEAATEAGKAGAKSTILNLDEQLRQLERAEIKSLGGNLAQVSASGVRAVKMGEAEVTGINELDYANPEQRYASSPTMRRTAGVSYGDRKFEGSGSVAAVLNDMSREFGLTKKYTEEAAISQAQVQRFGGNAAGSAAMQQGVQSAIQGILAGFT